EIIGGMQDTQSPPVCSLIEQLDRGRLVVVLKGTWRVLHLVDGRQFDTMAFELNSHSHLFARVSAGHIAASATDPAGRVRRADTINDCPCFRRQLKPL